jgi:FkbM family methyltransferase
MSDEKLIWENRVFYYREECWEGPVLRSVLSEDSYRFKKCRLSDAKVILDIGGHIGSFAAFAAHLHPDKLIKTWEMVPGNFGYLLRNIEGLPNVEPHNGVVVGDETPKGFVVHPTNSGGSRVVWSPGGEPLTTVCKVTDIVDGPICFLKMDCEGSEHGIIDSLVASGKIGLVDKMALEYHNFWGRTGDALRDTLIASGFKVETHVYNPSCGLMWVYRNSWEGETA